jgi:hypothetical protein
MKKEYPRNRFIYLVIICIFAIFHSCGHPDDDPTTGGGTGSTGSSTPSSLSLALSQVSVKSDDSDSSTITASVFDANNSPVEGETVTFATTGGAISAATATTDSTGECTITFSAGVESTNQTVTISATVSGLAPSQIPVQITGSTVTLTTDSTGLEIGGTDTATLTIMVQNAAPAPIFDTSVAISVDPSSTGTVTLSASTGNTDTSGELTVDVTGTGAGSVTVRVTAAGATATQAYTVGATGAVFSITSPTQDPSSLSTGSNLTISVNAPSVSNVGFATTIGAWDGGTDNVVTKAVSGGTASAILSSTVAGVATVQVYDSADTATSDSLTVAISAPSSQASKIVLQGSATSVARSEGSTTNTVTLKATVTNTTDQIVGSAPISFLIINPTGGGETISPVIISTDDFGVATTAFTSGSRSSDSAGVTIVARAVGSALAGPSTSIGFVDSNPDTITRSDGGSFVNDGFVNGDVIKVIGSTSNDGTYTVQTVAAATLTLAVAETLTAETAGETIVIGTIVDSISVVIGGTAGSIFIGQGTTITSINDNTAYQVPMSVLVADSNGNPMAGIQVSLKIWPSRYATGVWGLPVSGICTPVATTVNLNEDTNMNLTLEPGEDTNGDGQLTPPNSSAGSVPEDVTTDENGIANFDLSYLKSSAFWIEVELTATTQVVGSETQSTSTFTLGFPNTSETCLLPDSPYGP